MHQTEALLGIIISSSDSRAQSLLRDLAQDSLAKEIINRVDNSPYGVKGRKGENSNTSSKIRFGHIPSSNNSDVDGSDKSDRPRLDLTSTHPTNEWQDEVGAMLYAIVTGQSHEGDIPSESESRRPDVYSAGQKPALRVDLQQERSAKPPNVAREDNSPRERQRRRIDSDIEYSYGALDVNYSRSAPASAISPAQGSRADSRDTYSPRGSAHFDHQHALTSSGETTPNSLNENENENELTGAVGQLSLNEDAQLRYHGKVSGLHFLSDKVKVESRNEGGIWRFPKGGVWPALPPRANSATTAAEYRPQMPDATVQRHLLDLYFTYVHPSFPVIHKEAFFDAFGDTEASRTGETPEAALDDGAGCRHHSPPFSRKQRTVPPLLLSAMFAIAARCEDDMNNSMVPAPPTDPSTMWVAGDDYFNNAKKILDENYATSRPSTCQALLLMGYREIGIGAMAGAWTFIGMAIRMAHDLGMHRSADKWARADLGGKLFGERELNERKRIWYTCVIMDKYVSTYIGRPLMIFDQDFDTLMLDEKDPEEWKPCEYRLSSLDGKMTSPIPGRIISCFNASATLSSILGKIVQDIYAVRPQVSRHAVLQKLEALLDRWYIELPEYLRFDHSVASSRQKAVVPHVLTLHMQYWCAVLLLHRAFIGSPKQRGPEEREDQETRTSANKSYELCAGAANHITTIIS